jgi:hypothetical protein
MRLPTTTPARGAVEVPEVQRPGVPAALAEHLLSAEIFDDRPGYIKRIVAQVNGCWNHEYFEACATMIRRLLETLIIELYDSRGWASDLRDPQTRDFLSLKNMVGKVTGDARFGLDSRATRGLAELKELGDIAAHDYRIRVRKSDIASKRGKLRYTAERLLFHVSRQKKEGRT